MIVIGIGNPGTKYERNRHNVGKLFAQYWADSIARDVNHDVRWVHGYSKLFQSAKIGATHSDPTLIVTETFMNDSGRAVQSILKQYTGSTASDLYIAHDDLDIALGSFKIDLARGPKLHNGLGSIESHLHTEQFYRIRIGVDARPAGERIPGEAYVLHDFLDEEEPTLHRVFTEIIARLGAK